jgi:hypothetical protein
MPWIAGAQGRAGSKHRQDDLAFGAAGLQVGDRRLGLAEREDAVDDDFKLLGLDERGQIGQVGAARVHEQIAIADAMARGAQPRGQAGDPK